MPARTSPVLSPSRAPTLRKSRTIPSRGRRGSRAALERGTIGRTLLAIEHSSNSTAWRFARPRWSCSEQEAREGSFVIETARLPRRRATEWFDSFFSVGARDGLRTGDVLRGHWQRCRRAGTEVGKIEIRDSHTIVEVDGGGGASHHRKAQRQGRMSGTPRDRASGSGSWGTHDVRNAGT